MMKMKNFKLLTILLVGIMFFSCSEDNLDVDPVNEFLSENFYQTDDQVFSALVAAYDPLGWTMAFGNWVSEVMFNEIRSDNANAGGDTSDNDQPAWQEFDDFRNTNTNTVLQPMYRRYYIGIFRANLVIHKPEITSAAVDLFQAEAKFLRAYYHFELFKHFGPIPVVTEVLSPEDIDLQRNTMTEVFTAIESDLLAAIEVLPLSVSSGDVGRATKSAAQALLGKVYLYWADMANDDTQKFGQAADQLRDVVQSNIFTLEDDFSQLFQFAAKNPSESVFEIQKSNLWPSDWGWFEGIEGNGIVQLCGVRGICDDHPDYQAGWGFMLPTQELVNSFLPDDQYRLDAAVMSVEEIENEIDEAGGQCSVAIDETQSNPIDYTGYWQEKFANWKLYEGNNVNGGDPNLTKDANIYSIRYADVLLMLAEAIHRSNGPDSEAMGYIDIVRERAFGPGDNDGMFRTTSQLMSDMGWSLQDVIWYERRAEFAMEGNRWFDLVRSGRANAELFAGDPIRGANFNDNDLWLPISLEETTVATNLTEYPDASLFQ
jgi:hypothetical protein